MQIGCRAIGLQFHLETTPESAAAIVEHCRNELTPGEYMQSEQHLLTAPNDHYTAVNQALNSVLEYLTRG